MSDNICVEFHIHNQNEISIEIIFKVNGSIELTGNSTVGEIVTIFRTVGHMIESKLPELINLHNVSSVFFMCDKAQPSRKRYYNKFIVPYFNNFFGSEWVMKHSEEEDVLFPAGALCWKWSKMVV